MSMTMLVDKKEIKLSTGIMVISWDESIGTAMNGLKIKRSITIQLNETESLALATGIKNEASKR